LFSPACPMWFSESTSVMVSDGNRSGNDLQPPWQAPLWAGVRNRQVVDSRPLAGSSHPSASEVRVYLRFTSSSG
jgi:hypothetical protein